MRLWALKCSCAVQTVDMSMVSLSCDHTVFTARVHCWHRGCADRQLQSVTTYIQDNEYVSWPSSSLTTGIWSRPFVPQDKNTRKLARIRNVKRERIMAPMLLTCNLYLYYVIWQRKCYHSLWRRDSFEGPGPEGRSWPPRCSDSVYLWFQFAAGTLTFVCI